MDLANNMMYEYVQYKWNNKPSFWSVAWLHYMAFCGQMLLIK